MITDKVLINHLKEKGLSTNEVDQFLLIYKDCSDADRSLFMYEYAMKDMFKEYPVDINTFIHDPEYLGEIYGDGMFPIWEDMLKEIYPAPLIKNYDEAILSCATRAGKSVVITVSLLYEIHKLMCMINPAKTLLGVSNGILCFAVLSNDNQQAVGGVCDKVRGALAVSPFFRENSYKKLAFSSVDKEGVHITDNILLKAGSSVQAITGKEVYFGALDEANMPSGSIAADKLIDTRLSMYHSMLDRKQATFDKAPINLNGMMWMCSSPMDECDVIGERIREINVANTPRVLIKEDVARWEARGEIEKETFKFFLGSDIKDPCILNDDFDPIRYDESRILY